jgi:hypothetical protein
VNTIKYALWTIAAKIPFLYLGILILDILSALFSPAKDALGQTFVFANIIAGVGFVPYALFILEFGQPIRRKCEKCVSKIQIAYTLESGNDVGEPDEYEHIFKVVECPLCRHKKIRHTKTEKRKYLRTW